MSEKNNSVMSEDAIKVDEVMLKYDGIDGAHFGFIAKESGDMRMFFGGRMDLMGACISMTIGMLLKNTPEMDAEKFMEAVKASVMVYINKTGNSEEIQ